MCDDEKTMLNPKNGMSVEEAIEWIKSKKETEGNTQDATAMRMAIEALEKQMAKKSTVIAIRTKIKTMPEYCDDCDYLECRPHPYKGWTNSCALCMQCLDDDQEDGWIYSGNGRPRNCPLIEVDLAEATND